MSPVGNRHVRWLVICVVIIAASASLVYGIERDFGKVDVQFVRIVDPSGVTIAGKLYRPKWATPENKLPGVLNLHGYQNDKEVQAPFSIELARRGFVVLAVDAMGHGDSGGSLSFANLLSDPIYSAGTNTGYLYLKSLPFVDAANLGLMGHSMGGMEAVKLAYLNPDHKALNPHASLPGAPQLHNLLLTQARFDEFASFRENQPRTEDLTGNPDRLAKLGLTGPVEWDTTYGSFGDGTARRMALVDMDHHLLPLTNKAVAEAVDWMRLALKGGRKDAHWIEPTSQIFIWKEIFGLLALLVTVLSLIPLTNILLSTEYFKPVAQPMPRSRYLPTNRAWWLLATINALIGGILYPPLTGLGGLNDKVEAAIPWMKLQIGNGLFVWFLGNVIVAAILFLVWYRMSGGKAGVTMYDMGASFDEKRMKLDWRILGKTLLMGFLLFAWMYVLEGISQWALGVEFRFAWPFMRQFNSPRRVGFFFWYLLPVLAFFLINGGIFLFGQARQKEYRTPAKTQWIWWLKNVYACLFGLFLVWAFQYVPWFFFGKGPGFEEIGLAQYSGMWPLMLFVYIPEFAALLFMLTWFYRRTGRIYLGALMVSSLAMWFLTAGTIINV